MKKRRSRRVEFDTWIRILENVEPRIKILGRGHYSLVVEVNQNLVCKFWIEDRGYAAYFKFCQEQSSKHLPKFFNPHKLQIMRKNINVVDNTPHIKKSTIATVDVKYTVIEKLQPFSLEQLYSSTYLASYLYLVSITNQPNLFIMRQMNKTKCLKPLLAYHSITTQEQVLNNIDLFGTVTNEWKDLCNLIVANKPSYAKHDITHKNIMLRNDNTLVIIDPWG